MSVQLKAFAKGIDLSKIKTCLFGSDEVQVDILNDTVNCISPGGEIIVFGHNNKIITFTLKWFPSPTNDVCEMFQTVWTNNITQTDKENITSVICLPIAIINTKISTHCSADWFCIVIGFSSGYVKFYTEDGDLLISQLFHNSAVIKLRCQSHQPAKISPPTVEQPEEIAILYSTVVCTIVGVVFVNSLRSYKNQLTRNKFQAKCVDNISIPPLVFKKWAFDVQKIINDAAIGARYDITSFQHVVAANICGGISGDKQNSLPQMTQIIAAGKEPYLAFHYTIGKLAQPTLGNITKAIASKLKSSISQSLPLWLSYNLSLNESSDMLESSEQLGCRLNDLECEALRIELSPQLSIGVISDNLERVTLFEVNAGGIIRTWEGYKDVQFGWLVVNENKSSTSKQALFLVMYIPNRGALEIWAMQNYEKISVSEVSKHGKLFYTNFGLLGALSTSRMNIYNANYRCYFVDETKIITEINVPYHCIESGPNSQLSHDIYAFKTFKSLCNSDNIDDEKLCEEVVKLVNSLMTDKIRQQVFNYITTSKHMTQKAVVEFLKNMQIILAEKNQYDSQNSENLLKNVNCHLKLVKFLTFLFNFQKKHNLQSLSFSTEDKTQELCKTLRLSDQDMDKIISLLPIEPKKKTVVMFCANAKLMNLTGLLSCFDTTGENISVKMDTNVDELCKHIFEPIMHIDNDIGEWNLAWIASGIQMPDMVYLAVQYWLSKPLTLTVVTEMLNFHRIIDTICSTNGENLDWKKTRDQFSNSSNTFTCLTGAIICKTISSSRKTVKVNNEWECISGEDYQWNLLIERLEQLCYLNGTLNYCSEQPVGTLYCIKYEYLSITLTDLLKHGQGGVSTLVSKWLASIGLDPILLVDEYFMDFDKNISTPSKLNKVTKGIQDGIAINIETAVEARALSMAEKETLDALRRLKSCFPYSLDCNTLLSNICWEYAIVWKNCVADLKALNAFLDVAEKIPCPHTRQSICYLIWCSCSLSNTFLSAIWLIDRVGKIPKEKLCIQDVGMPDQHIIKFFGLCERFFEIIIKASLSAEEVELAEIKHDLFWENWKTNNQHKLTLVQTALNKPNPDQNTLFLSHQFVRAFYILAKFSIHISKPLYTLFDCTVHEIDFSKLNQNTFNQEEPRTKVKKSRADFLANSIATAIELIQKDCEDGQYEFESKECMFWINKIFQLAIDWQLNLDNLRIHQVISLYAKGHDRLAEEIVPAVNNKEDLVKHLLNVIKHRLKFEVCINDLDFHDKIVHFSPEMVSWLNGPVTMDVEKSLLKETLELVQIVATLLHENDSQHEFVTNLIDSLISLIDS